MIVMAMWAIALLYARTFGLLTSDLLCVLTQRRNLRVVNLMGIGRLAFSNAREPWLIGADLLGVVAQRSQLCVIKRMMRAFGVGDLGERQLLAIGVSRLWEPEQQNINQRRANNWKQHDGAGAELAVATLHLHAATFNGRFAGCHDAPNPTGH